MKITLTLAALLVCATACSGTHENEQADPTKIRNTVLMLASLLPKKESDDIHVALIDGRESLIRQCMAADGFTYTPESAGSFIDFSDEVDPRSQDDAKARGFGVTTLPHFDVQSSDNDLYYKSLTPERQKGFSSRFSDCSTSAAAETNSEQGLDAAQKLYEHLTGEISGASEYRNAVINWSTCASDAGFQGFSDRESLVDSFMKRRTGIVAKIFNSGGGMPQDPKLLAKLEEDSNFIGLRRDEIAAATATFPCTRAFDAVRSQLMDKMLQKELPTSKG